MKTKLKHILLLGLSIAFFAPVGNAQSLTTEYNDHIYGISSSLGLSFQIISIDETQLLHITHRALSGNKLEILLDFIDLENNTTTSIKHLAKGYHTGNAYVESGKLVMTYGPNLYGPHNLLILDLKSKEITSIHLKDIHKDFKKFRHVEQFRITERKLYFVGFETPTSWILGAYDFETEDIEYKLYPSSVYSIGLHHTAGKLIICKTESSDAKVCISTIGYLEEDFSITNENNFLKGQERFVRRTNITENEDGTFLITGAWSPTIGAMHHTKLFWMNWDSEQIVNYGEISVAEAKIQSSFYDEKEKNNIRKKDSKKGYCGKWEAKQQNQNALGEISVLFQNDFSSYALINTNDKGEVNWSYAAYHYYGEISPFELNSDNSRQFITIEEKSALINLDYIDDNKIKSIDFSLEDGSFLDTYESEKLMELKSDGAKTVPLKFITQVTDDEYVIYQVFESGSKFTLDNSEYTRRMYVRHVFID